MPEPPDLSDVDDLNWSAPSNSGWEEVERAAAELLDAGLVLPPVPDELAPGFRQFGPWSWGTRELDFGEAYLFAHFANREGPVVVPADYVALRHAGHGVNSYALGYHLVHRPVAILFQVGWGGVYADQGVDAARFAWQCALASGLVDLASRVRQSTTIGERVVVVQVSDFREIARCDVIGDASTVIPIDEQQDVFSQDLRHGEIAYAKAAAWLVSQIGDSTDV